MRVSAVIPNWNGLRFLCPLAEDLRAQSVPFDRIILVDNGSKDGSPEWAERAGWSVIRLSTNRGFAVAVNRGVMEARSELVAVLNNDLRLDIDWLRSMLAGIGVGAFAVGKVLMASDPGRIDGTWDALCRGGAAWRCGHGQPDGPEWDTEREIAFPPFTAVLLRRAVFLDAGGLDEAFGSYLEDVDFGLRCASKGHTGRYVPNAVSRHYGSATLGRWDPRTVRQVARNQLLLISRNYTRELVRRYGWQIAIAQMLWGVVAIRHGCGASWVSGKVDGLRAFREMRRAGSAAVGLVLERSEQEIRRSKDWYWRLYFALT